MKNIYANDYQIQEINYISLLLTGLIFFVSDFGIKHADLKKFLSQHKIYISLTTSPERINFIAEILENLDLSMVDKVIIAIPQHYAPTNGTYTIPENLASNDKILILPRTTDLGPIMKLIPAVEYIQLQPDYTTEDIIITIDDDVIYPRNMVSAMATKLIESDAVVGAMMYKIGQGATKLLPKNHYPWNLSYNNFLEKFIQGNILWQTTGLKKRQFVVGHGGVAYKASWINTAQLIHDSQLSKNCFKSDDLVISYYLQEKNIPVAKLKTDQYSVAHIIDMEHGDLSDALHNIDVNEIKYLGCYVDLLQRKK